MSQKTSLAGNANNKCRRRLKNEQIVYDIEVVMCVLKGMEKVTVPPNPRLTLSKPQTCFSLPCLYLKLPFIS